MVANHTNVVLERIRLDPVSYTHLRAHETVLDLVCRLLLEKKKTKHRNNKPIIMYNDIIASNHPVRCLSQTRLTHYNKLNV